MKNIERTVLLSSRIVVGIITLIAIYSCSKTLATNESISKVKEAIPVHVSELSTGNLSIPVYISGTIGTGKETRLSFKTGGIIEDIYVHEGNKVTKGQLLAQLDLKEINQQVLQARIGLNKAKRDHKRVENLFADTVTTLQQLEHAKIKSCCKYRAGVSYSG